MRLTIKKHGIKYVLKTCPACGDEWYALRKANRCSLCGGGLVRRTPQNIDLNWDELPHRQGKMTGRFAAIETQMRAAIKAAGG